MDSWQKLGDITKRIADRLEPIPFSIVLDGPLGAAVKREAARSGNRPETIIAEAVRSYLGDSA